MLFGLLLVFSLQMLAGCSSTSGIITPAVRTVPVADETELDTSWVYPPSQEEMLSLDTNRAEKILTNKSMYHFEPYIPQDLKVETTQRDTVVSSAATKVVSGYRVQLYAGRDIKLAQDVKENAESLFEVPIFLIFMAPQYKVRAGNFENRENAQQLCDIAHQQGYRDAWVVQSQIEITP